MKQATSQLVALVSPSHSARPERRRESAKSLLAKNLMVARAISGLTQHDLASASGVSRATIAQLETGISDPRLSTVVELAGALGIAPIVLLIGPDEVGALAELHREEADLPVPDAELARMRFFVESGMLKDRARAARIGASLARAAGHDSAGATLTAAIFSAILPGAGTAAGTTLGKHLG